MPAQPEHTALPLEQFIAQLQAAGFHIDTGRKLRLLRLLNQKSGEYIGRFSELKYVLAPFIASSPAEQQRFYEFFDAFIEDCNREMEQWADRLPHEQYLPLTTPRPDNKTHKLWRRLGWIGMVILLATAALFVVKKWLEPEPIPLRIETGPELTPTVNNPYPILREGRQHQFAAQPANADTARYIWELRDAMSDVIELRDTGRYFDYTANGYGRDIRVIARSHDLRADSLLLHIHCAVPPPMPQWNMPEVPALEDKSYGFGIAPPGPDTGVQWIFNSRDTLRGAKVSYTFAETGEATVECKVFRDSTDCYSWEQRKFTIGAGKPILSLADLIYDDTPPTVVRQSPKSWVWLLCFLPLLPAVWFLRRWWRQRREKPVSKPVEILVGEHPIHDKAPYFIPYLPPDGKISTPPDFYRMAEVLRRREESEHRELDIPASVRATVDGGGFPTLLDKSNTTPPDYLFIIERASAQDQQGRLFERLSSFFLQQDAPLTAYFHEGGFRGFWNDAHPQGVSFEFLQKQHSDCRLVLIGTGHGLLDPRNTREPALLRAQLDPLLRWKKALFLSTLPVSGWFAPEVLLHRHFLLYPADAEGIRAGLEALDALEEHEPAPFTKWESALAVRRNDRNPRFQLWESAEQHRAFLQPDIEAFRWLCGLAVSVSPDFALTVAIGRKLGVEVSHDRLLRLTRIPWLSRNEPDNRLQLELLALLSPEEECLARQAVAEELEAVRHSVEGSFAHIEWKTNLAIHRFALDPENPEHRQTLRDLMQVGLFSGSQLQELDGFVRRRLAPSSLAGANYGIVEYLDQPDPKPFFTASLRRALAWAALALGLLFLIGQQQRVLPPTLIKTVTQSDSAVIWHNQAIDTALAIRGMSAYSQWEKHDTSEVVEALFEKALKARKPYPLAERNVQAFYYNLAAQEFNFAVQDSIRGLDTEGFFRFELPDTVLRSKRLQAIASAGNLFQAIAGADTTNRLGWAARHGYGLCAYYLAKDYQAISTDSAHASYQDIMRLSGGMYFDSIRTTMPVNLQTLLNNAPATPLPINKPVLTGWDALRPFIWCIDAAHGSLTPGKRSPMFEDGTRLFEYQLTRDIVARILPQLQAYGISYFEVTPEVDVDDFLKGRVDRINNLKTDRTKMLVSVHFNAAPSPSAEEWTDDRNRGIETWFLHGNAHSQNLASVFQKQLVENTGMRNKNIKSQPNGQFFILRSTNAIAITTENGFYNNKKEALLLRTDEMRQLIANAHVQAILEIEGIPVNPAITPKVAIPQIPDSSIVVNPKTDTNPALSSPLQKLEADMVRVAGGSFTMGCQSAQRDGECYDWEKPPRTVRVRDFSIGRYEVTQAQWRAVMGSDPPKLYNKGCDECPVEQVSWNDIKDFLTKLNTLTGKRYRLPTEAEWEYAARGGSQSQSRGFLYSGSNTIDEVAWYEGNYKSGNTFGSQKTTRPVGTKKANELGLYDMSGNVWEWCEDDWHENYNGAPTDGSAWVNSPRGGSRVLRGGGWSLGAWYCRVAFRVNYYFPSRGSDSYGFRLAL